MTRVQIPAYTDRWMMGDRYGTIDKVKHGTIRKGDKVVNVEIAYVKLDKSGKVVRVILGDCVEV